MGGLIVKEVKYNNMKNTDYLFSYLFINLYTPCIFKYMNYLFINLVIRGYLWRIVTLNIKVSRNKRGIIYLINGANLNCL